MFSRPKSRLRFEVTDDGPGIEPRYQTKIFELFKTLKSRDLVEGSGLGLALVAKLTDRFGGFVSVHSDAPATRGAKFISEFPNIAHSANAELAA